MPDPLAAAERDAKIAAKVRQIRFPWRWKKLEREGFFTDLGPISTAALIDFFQKRTKSRRLLEQLVQFLCLIPICLFMYMYPKIEPGVSTALGILFLCGINGAAPYLLGTHQRNIARILAGSKSSRAMPALIAGLPVSGGRTREILQNAIAQLLLDADHDKFDVLQNEDRKTLYGSIHTGPESYTLTIVEVALRFQDVSAFDDIKRLANTRAAPFGKNRTVRKAARACMKPLREKLDYIKRNEKLLRPVNPPAGEELLRPAGHNGTSDDLLRAVLTDSNEFSNTTGHHT